MIVRFFERLISRVVDLNRDALPPFKMRFSNEWLRKRIESDPDLPCEAGGPPELPGDGRMFGWQRTRNGRTPIMPVVIFDQREGCNSKEFVGQLYLIKPREYHLTINELAKIYPAPDVAEHK